MFPSARPHHSFSLQAATRLRIAFGLGLLVALGLPLSAQDILRRGRPAAVPQQQTVNSSNAAAARAAAEANQASANARDSLARTTRAVDSVRAMQNAARATAAAQASNNLGLDPNTGLQLPNVPNGLQTGGLDLLSIQSGANAPTQSTAAGAVNVTIKQTEQQALLNWRTFNVGRETSVYFDQTAGGVDTPRWTAFNKIADPSGNPTQILGSIRADGQVYVLNPNGVIFGANSQVNARGLTAASIPINDNLIASGLLNNPDADFLFSALDVPGGTAAPSFSPAAAVTANGEFGDVVVQQGAQITSPVTSDGSGGRVMLVGSNVANEGSITTPNGQTILAAGLQVGVAAHDSNDPSLRGLDVFVGNVGSYAGTAINSGMIESTTGSVTIAGRDVQQLGSILSTTSVALNGRIDIAASYGAVANPGFDESGGAPRTPFLFQETGLVTFGSDSVTRILPDYASSATVAGSALPEASQINIDGQAIRFRSGALVLAPNANVNIRAGVWPYSDPDGNRTTLDSGGALEPNLNVYFSGGAQQMLFNEGQVYFESGSLLDTSGSTDVFVPLSQNVLSLQLLGPELADSPLQRTGEIRGQDLVIDLREEGVFDGRFWVGTPLGDATGFLGLIERNAAQLTTAGGNVSIQAGASAVMQPGSVINVSGGFTQNEGGLVQTSRLSLGGYAIDVADATPDLVYDGLFTDSVVETSSRWGITNTFTMPLAPTGGSFVDSYVSGAAGGSLSITAPSMALDGELIGRTIEGPRQRDTPADLSSLSLSFTGNELFSSAFESLNFIPSAPTPPQITFRSGSISQAPADPFTTIGNTPLPIRADRQANVSLSPNLVDEQGFGQLTVVNPDGDITIPADVSLEGQPRGSITLTGANVAIGGSVLLPGGNLSLTALNLSPNEFEKLPPSNFAAAPAPTPGRGVFTLESGAALNVAGLLIDDRLTSSNPLVDPLATTGGSISIEAFSAIGRAGSAMDVSGGAVIGSDNTVTYGDAGQLSILTGLDPSLSSIFGGTLNLESSLSGFSGTANGGELTLRATGFQIGGTVASPQIVGLSPGFFQDGGFTQYNLIGIGASSTQPIPPGGPDPYLPGVLIAPGTVVEPRAEELRVIPFANGADFLAQQALDPVGQRAPASVRFEAIGADEPFTGSVLEARGDINTGAGSRISVDPGASIELDGQTVTVLGSLVAPGGTISISGDASFPLPPADAPSATFARPTVHLGSDALLLARGATTLQPDAFGRRIGSVSDGGTISLSGNIVAEAGAVLDVSGTSDRLDFAPEALGILANNAVPPNSGLTAPLYSIRSLPAQVDSSGGLIRLEGSEMLYADATLIGRSGGPSATAGTLSVYSGRFYQDGVPVTGADINMAVSQDTPSLAPTNVAPGIGIPVLDGTGATLSGAGTFAANRFANGGFASLELGADFFPNARVPVGGNLSFEGPVTINAPGYLRLAGGGVIQADSRVTLSASYLSVGQPFREPQHPSDIVFPFQQNPAIPSIDFPLAPTAGSGALDLTASAIDVGNLSLQTIGSASLNAPGGDIRGNGTFNLAGNLSLNAGQIYPTTLSSFDIFAYPGGGDPGTVNIAQSGARPALPLSAGGDLNIFASSIRQAGTLRAPQGRIQLGWDGNDFDLETTAFDSPFDAIARDSIAVPTATDVTLTSSSFTSVAGTDAISAVPFGVSLDGLSWIDPRGINVTTSGLAQKTINLGADQITTEAGSTVDLRGGGDLYAYQWVRGSGGTVDLLGEPSSDWAAGVEYEAGDLVTFEGQTWSARIGHSGQAPEPSLFWTLVPEAFAILPGFGSGTAPYAAFNTGNNASALGGATGYESSLLQPGDRIFLEESAELSSGFYTLLPRGYARLPGAFLVIPDAEQLASTLELPDGASSVSGYRFNPLQGPTTAPDLRSRFEIVPPSVVEQRVEYEDYFANSFLSEAATRLAVETTQRLPIDAGSLAIQGNTGLQLDGGVLASRPTSGRGSPIDVSSFSDLYLIGGSGSAPGGSTAVLDTSVLSSWGAESLLIGGRRVENGEATVLNVRSPNITVDNPGGALSSPEITLASQEDITITGGSAVTSSGPLSSAAETLSVTGDGSLLRVSGDFNAQVSRSGVVGSTSPLFTLGAGALLDGTSVTLESTYGTSLDDDAILTGNALSLGSGQISLLLQDPVGGLTGSVVDPHLVLSSELQGKLETVESLTLQSFRTIDVYGDGAFGGQLARLELLAGGIRGYDQGTGTAALSAGEVLFANPSASANLAAPATTSGTLQVDANLIQLGANTNSVTGFSDLNLNAGDGLVAQGAGSLSTGADLTVTTPLITGERGSTYELTSSNAVTLLAGTGTPSITPELGASLAVTGSQITADTSLLFPSGQLSLNSTAGDVSVGGELSVEGSSQTFFDQIRFADAGQITLESLTGNVDLRTGSRLSVAADPVGGDAGSLTVNAALGQFFSDGTLLGTPGNGGESGSFELDASSIPSYASIRDDLFNGGFTRSQSFRLRDGSITLDGATQASDFSFSVDQGSLTVAGTIDASGVTGGRIALAARDNLTVQSGAVLTAAAQQFSNAGKGGEVRLEAGAQSNGVVNSSARLTLEAGSIIDLSVAEFVAGDYTTPGSSAFEGKLPGTLYLRAPQVGNDVGVNAIQSDILGASSVLVEAFRLYDLTDAASSAATGAPASSAGGIMNIALRDQIDADAAAFMTAGEAAMRTKLLTGSPDPLGLAELLVLAPGAEIINRTGDLTLGLANQTGSTNPEALSTADWDLSGFRYGSENSPGVLTMRAQGDLVFNNALSDGFVEPPFLAFLNDGDSGIWLGTPQTLNPDLPLNTQSWSYRLTAGADFSAADFESVLPLSSLAVDKGSILVGEFYPAVPNSSTGGSSPAIGNNGLTANNLRINSASTADRGTRYEVIRTGTGSIDVNAGRDVQLRNTFASIYTSGVTIPTPTTVFQADDFVVPIIPQFSILHPQDPIGGLQQLATPAWTFAGGNVSVRAGQNVGRYTMRNGSIILDSSRQLPTNWLLRRGYVGPDGTFAADGGVDGSIGTFDSINDTSPSTTWWVDFTNFFQGVGALGGGDVSLIAGRDIVNVDAVIPTNARMAGRDPSTGQNLAPDEANLVEWGGGDLTVQAGRDISGGVYHVERGVGSLFAGREITTNEARSPSLGILGATGQPTTVVQSQNPAIFDPLTWLPTTLFAGRSEFDVKARGDILLGPVSNAFLLPQGLTNQYYYKSYFHTFGEEAGADVTSFGGGITHRLEATLPGSFSSEPILNAWMRTQNLFAGTISQSNASWYQPWLRLSETNLSTFETVFSVGAPSLRSTAFAGDLTLAGSLSLFPSPTGTVELLSSDGIVGITPTGRTIFDGQATTIYTSAAINLSDADPSFVPGITSPIAYQSVDGVGRDRFRQRQSEFDVLNTTSALFEETGAFTNVSQQTQIALHDSEILHRDDRTPARLYAGGGDISGLTFFSSKSAQIAASRDITDVAFYLQNTSPSDISLVSAGRDIVAFNANSPLRSIATNTTLNNLLGNSPVSTVDGGSTNAQAGDLQISGQGLLEILAGRNLDLGTGANFTDGTGVGITSIGNSRNPFLPSDGASIIAMAGVPGNTGSGPAIGLSGSSLDFASFINEFVGDGSAAVLASDYLQRIGSTADFASLSEEQQAVVSLEVFYQALEDAGADVALGGTYDRGFEAIATLFSGANPNGDVFTRARDIRTTNNGAISLAAPAGGLTMAANIFGNPLAPPGVVTEAGGPVSLFTDDSVDIGQARIFTLLGGDLLIWSSTGDIAAGSAPRTVVTAPPTRVLIDSNSATVQTDLGGLATGGGIGVLASVEGVQPGNVALIAPAGVVDAGDAGIRATGDITIAATAVLNATNIAAGGTATGVPSAPTVAAPNIGGLSSASAAAAATSTAADQVAEQTQQGTAEAAQTTQVAPSIVTVEVIGYGGGGGSSDEEDEDR